MALGRTKAPSALSSSFFRNRTIVGLRPHRANIARCGNFFVEVRFHEVRSL